MRAVLLFSFFLFANTTLATTRICTSATLPTLPTEGFESAINRFASKFQPHHSVNDAIAALGQSAQIEAKFTFGSVAKDMSKEFVELWVDVCDEYFVLLDRQLTDSDGRVIFTVDTSLLEEPGSFSILMRAVGDGSTSKATLRVVPAGRKVAVFDIDGTLSAYDGEVSFDILYDIYHGVYAPPKRLYAAELTHLLRDKFGYEIVYLSGRPHFMNNITRKWLADNEFAPGTVKITQNLTQMLPTQSYVGQYKSDQLVNIKNAGLLIPRAYGNAETDVFAYKDAGIPDKKIFMLGKYSGFFGAVGLGKDYESHYLELSNAENGVLD